MAEKGTAGRSSPIRSPSRFGVYQNAEISSALAAPRRTSSWTIIRCVYLLILCGYLLSISYRKGTIRETMRVLMLNYLLAKIVVRVYQGIFTLVFAGLVLALIKAILLTETFEDVFKTSAGASSLTPRQQKLIGQKNAKVTPPPKPPKQSPSRASPNVMFPLHSSLFKSPKAGAASPTTPVQVSTFPHTPMTGSSPDHTLGFKFKRDEIHNQEQLENFLSEVNHKMSESAGKPPTTPQGAISPSPIRVVASAASPNVTTPHSPGNTPVRALRVSPSGGQKSGVSPKKAEGDLPAPFSLEQGIDGFRKLGIWPDIEHWRDGLRQWFSDVLLVPLLHKIDRSHLQVMETAAKLGYSLVISPIGGKRNNPTQAVEGSSQEWLTTFAPDEDALIHQFRAFLVNAKNASSTPSIFGLRIPNQEVNPALQECLDAVTEHQRLHALVKGEWVKGLLPQSSVRADYTVQRLRELAEGTCVRNYEFAGTGEVYDKTTKRWTLELPTDAHLLVYLFCALLEHPQWMLHVDPISHPSTQSGNNPLFIANLPQKERFPEKYIAVLSGAPPVLHAGACVLAVGKQSPPIFALYWDKRLQFSLQGRTALWDAILLLCHRIKVAHGGTVRGVNLGGSAFNLLSILEQRRAES